MTPNQAEELHDIIRTSGLPDVERDRLHAVVARNVDSFARKGIAYISVYSNGDPVDTRIDAVDVAGRTIQLEVSSIEFKIDCKRSELKLKRQNIGVGAGAGDEVVLMLPTNDLVIRRIAEVLAPVDLNTLPDLDDPPELPPLPVPAPLPPPPAPAKQEERRGPHQHVFINGVCNGCLKRE